MSTARQFQSADEMRQNAAAVHARLLYGSRRPRVVNIHVPKAIITPPAQYWQRHKTYHDSHVYAWRRWKEAAAQPLKVYIKRRCRELGYAYAAIIGEGRNANLVLARQTLMWEIKRLVDPSISICAIGRLFNRDHKTTIHALRKIDAMLSSGETKQ